MKFFASLCLAALPILLLACSSLTSRRFKADQPVAREPGAQPVVIDTDMAPDDWLAILYLLALPEVDVRAITVTGTGEAHCQPGVRNALDLVQLAGWPDIPISCGRETPLVGDRTFPPPWRERVDALFGLELPANPRSPASESAVDLLRREINARPGQLHILALGPLTDLAELFLDDPAIAGQIGRITIMGGAVKVPGNVHVWPGIENEAAEWNIYVDPYAAQVVLNSGAPITLVPLDATNQVPAGIPFLNRLKENRTTSAADFAYRYLDRRLEDIGAGFYYFWDPLAAAILTRPDLATYESLMLVVDQADGPTSGATQISPEGAPVNVALSADRARFEDLFIGALNRR